MSTRVSIDVDGGTVTVRIRDAGRCSCGATGEVHDPACAVLEPGRVDLVLGDPMWTRRRRPWWWRTRRGWRR